MKYVLFVLGLLLLAVGAFAIYFGAGAVDAERGWTSVIAGTTAFVGGVLTLGIASVVRVLDKVRALLQANEMNATIRAALAPIDDRGEDRREDYEPTVPPVAWPPHTAAAHLVEPDTGLATSGFVEAEAAFADFAVEAPEPPNPPRDLHATQREPAKSGLFGPDRWRRAAQPADTTQSRRPQEPYIAEPLAMQPALRAASPAPSVPQPPEVPPPVEAKTSVGNALGGETSDWLDQALAELDSAIAHPPQEAPTFAAAREAHHEAQPSQSAAPAAREPTQPESAAEETAAEASAAATEPAIIGRYDAEGTCYIMFADGSIEAQSEQGVARFGSMAELKAYFESQEALQHETL